MNKFFTVIATMMVLVSSSNAFAYKSSVFKGWYEILSQTNSAEDVNVPPKKEYMLIDVDTLGNIWAKYGSGPLPKDLEQYRQEPSILAGFTNQNLLFLNLEKSALIADGYLSLAGTNGNALELQKKGNGQFDMATRDNGHVSRYLLSGPTEHPSNLRNSLILPQIVANP